MSSPPFWLITENIFSVHVRQKFHEQFKVGSEILSRKFKNLISNTACKKYSSFLGGWRGTISAATSAPLAGLCMYACIYVCMYVYGIYTYTVYVCMYKYVYPVSSNDKGQGKVKPPLI